MGESRMELVAWLNDLLQLNYRKVEQAGTGRHFCHVIHFGHAHSSSSFVGAAYCQVMDSIFGKLIGTMASVCTKKTH